MTQVPEAAAPGHDIVYPSVIPFLIVHLGCFAAIWTGITWPAVLLCVALYWLRMFAVTAGYHRYFSHRSFATGRVFQFILAFLAQSTAQKSVLWWAAKHRHHHLHSDTIEDVHSPRHAGFLYSHVGWIFARSHGDTEFGQVPDLARHAELRLLDKVELAPAFLLAGFCFLVAGWPGLVVGFLWSTVLVYHATFCINSLAHVRGSTRYVTGDDSRNNPLLAVLTMGEGWHNNHHAYQASVRQGFRWWEIDPTYYILRALSWLGIVWDLKTPPRRVLRNEQRLNARVIVRAAEQLAACFTSEVVTRAIAVPALGESQNRAPVDVPSIARLLKEIPGREEFLVKARSMFVRTPSLDEIVDHAYKLFLASVAFATLGARPAPVEGRAGTA